MRLLIQSFIFLTLCSCNNNTVPNDVIAPEQMKIIVWDVLQADELALQNKVEDSSLNLKNESFRLYDQVFAIHKTNRQQYFKSYKYYQQHPDLYRDMMQQVKEIAEKQKKDTSNTPGLNTPLKKANL